MGIKFFGQYLIWRNIITPQQLIEAVEYQESRNLRFGDYARSKGYLTESDVKRIQDEQKRTDMFFGELAVKTGILSLSQVEEILTMQKNDHVYIGAALVKKGFITPDVLKEELALFKEDQKEYITGEIKTPPGVSDAETVKDMVDITRKMLRRVAHIDVKIGEGFISDKEPGRNFATITIRLGTGLKQEYIFSSSLGLSRTIASGIIGGSAAEETKEIITDAVKEFCNITCGNIIAKMARRGKNVDITPPEEAVCSEDGYHLINGRKAVYYPLISPEGVITLILIE